MSDIATLNARLEEAEAALHALLTARKPVTLRKADGSTVTYQLAQGKELQAYVSDLKAQIAVAGGGRGRRAIGVSF